MANYPQELAQDAVCQSHTGHMTGLWFLPTRSLRLNTNEWMNLCAVQFSGPVLWTASHLHSWCSCPFEENLIQWNICLCLEFSHTKIPLLLFVCLCVCIFMFLRGKFLLCLWSISGKVLFSWDGYMVTLSTHVLKNINNVDADFPDQVLTCLSYQISIFVWTANPT